MMSRIMVMVVMVVSDVEGYGDVDGVGDGGSDGK